MNRVDASMAEHPIAEHPIGPNTAKLCFRKCDEVALGGCSAILDIKILYQQYYI